MFILDPFPATVGSGFLDCSNDAPAATACCLLKIASILPTPASTFVKSRTGRIVGCESTSISNTSETLESTSPKPAFAEIAIS